MNFRDPFTKHTNSWQSRDTKGWREYIMSVRRHYTRRRVEWGGATAGYLEQVGSSPLFPSPVQPSGTPHCPLASIDLSSLLELRSTETNNWWDRSVLEEVLQLYMPLNSAKTQRYNNMVEKILSEKLLKKVLRSTIPIGELVTSNCSFWEVIGLYWKAIQIQQACIQSGNRSGS